MPTVEKTTLEREEEFLEKLTELKDEIELASRASPELRQVATQRVREVREEVLKSVENMAKEKTKSTEIDLHQTIRGNITGNYSLEIRIPKTAREILGINEKTEFGVRVNPSTDEIILKVIRSESERSKGEESEVTVISIKRKE